MRPEALATLRDSDLIIHCGDVGDSAVLEVLQTLAPVRAIRGNNDKGRWACSLPTCDLVEVGSHKIYVLHILTTGTPQQFAAIDAGLITPVREMHLDMLLSELVTDVEGQPCGSR